MIELTGKSGNNWDRLIATVLVMLIGSGVLALFRMNDSVVRLEERVSSWTFVYEKRFEAMDREYNRRFEAIDARFKSQKSELH